MELISLSDGDSSFRVRVLGRRSPGVLHLHDQFDAEILVTSSFVSGRLAMSLSPSDLENWSRALDLLAAGEDIHSAAESGSVRGVGEINAGRGRPGSAEWVASARRGQALVGRGRLGGPGRRGAG
ncbi:DUF5959 family protein [Streptomyces sp. NPDC056672]|uniref:DUF5959 family protein n=1 Tax=Streptomyces sp. NPDC056672 TaxID=3345906 RepID=UPI0036C504B9